MKPRTNARTPVVTPLTAYALYVQTATPHCKLTLDKFRIIAKSEFITPVLPNFFLRTRLELPTLMEGVTTKRRHVQEPEP